jgi:hypothetical protein
VSADERTGLAGLLEGLRGGSADDILDEIEATALAGRLAAARQQLGSSAAVAAAAARVQETARAYGAALTDLVAILHAAHEAGRRTS